MQRDARTASEGGTQPIFRTMISPQCDMPSATLVPHPATPFSNAWRINVEAKMARDNTLVLSYRLQGDLEALRIPAMSSPTRADGLWCHTCFEAFLRSGNASGYYELNLAPSTEWAVYEFFTYREAMKPLALEHSPQITVRREPDNLNLNALIDLSAFVGVRDAATLELALSAVLEDAHGRLSYWALTHPRAEPDFHHAGSFTMQVRRGPP
jgi:hypothetical protein